MSRRLLIVSPHWPPVNAPDLQRVRMSLPYYAEHGWSPVVLCVHADDVAGVREPDLLETVAPEARVETCRAWPLAAARRFGLGNLGLRAWNALREAGNQLLARERFDLVFFSNTQFVTYTLGPYWRRRYDVPYVIDLQDPWRTDYYERPGAPKPPGGRKYLLARFIARWAEQPTYRRAAGFISVSERYREDLSSRYPWFANKPSATIGFGVSERDVAVACRRPSSAPVWSREPGVIHLLYTGAAGPIMRTALDLLLVSLRRLSDEQPAVASRLRLHFYGTSYAPPGRGTPSVLPIATTHGVAAMVDEIPHRLGYLESLALQQHADALLLVGSDDPGYSPSKLYPYFLAGKPMLAVVSAGSQLETLLCKLNCATLALFGPKAPADHGQAAIARFLRDALNGFPPAAQPARDEARFRAEFLAPALTERQCRLFDQAIATERSIPSSP